MARTVTQEMRDKVVELYARGMSRKAVAAEVGVSLPLVTDVLTERGVEIRPHFSRAIPTADLPAIARRYSEGAHISEIASEYGCTELTIRKVLDRQGVQRRDDRGRRRHFTDSEIATIRRLAAEGKTQSQIALAVQSGQPIVSKVMRQQGIPLLRTGYARGSSHGKWAGGRIKHPSGYWQINLESSDPMFSMVNRSGYVMEHRLVMARIIGRSLLATESVHHIDGDRLNNDPSNLQLRKGQHGSGVVMRCLDCGSHNVEAVKISEA
jgi:transposase